MTTAHLDDESELPMRRTSRLLRAAIPLGLFAVLAAACSPNDVTDPGGSDASDGDASAELIYGNTDGGTTYVLNFNVFSPATDKSPNSNLVYEPLVRIDHSDGGTIAPWLAESWEFTEDGTSLTFTLRDDVTFSDGEPMTADDVAYSLSIPLEHPELNASGATYSAVEATGDGVVQVTFEAASFSVLNQFANLLIVPEHLWAEQDLTTWTNPEPVGTGGFTVEDFSPQQITFAARDDYWGGEFQVTTVKVVPVTQDTVKSQLLAGDVEWGTVSWANGEEEFVGVNPDTNLYQRYATGGSYAAWFNTAQAPFDDVHVRRALAMTIPRTDIVATLNRPGTEANPSGLQDGMYDDWLLPEFQGAVQDVDVDGALAELAQSGYTIENGALVKDGESYAPTISFNTDFGWDAYADMMINSWRENLGLEVAPAGSPGAALLEQQQLGDFDITINTAGGSSVFGAFSGLSSEYVLPEGEQAAANFGRWDDAATDEVLEQMAATADEAELRELGYEMQRIVVDDVPFSPIYASYWFININATSWTGWPTPEDFEYVPFPQLGPATTLTLLGLEPTGS
ncbi:extracellular solute-binding protein family 5 [Beutenbergia cavernae DSM 12333]|uniref:Extracellular solute-binding protein family 5 n=1 Tax=Beutenbergia cavernae (strain ATCC BAA-8 / DSM 12333 / CCUG 43141 / JCM 11478 / NBRC 16432 / NCIMB 13614 / HKI 0122) TaxID=471853 RepID=C5BY73_BEUC1|nr:ABC transporter substrate-binding protein [Beutenbergia cavernae]ACQ80973.1 extracellular solute-binding protein family 5 [Beutenbergia cavernae DSM 12333]